jgi:glucose-6-phosphate 1-dehydrogenase
LELDAVLTERLGDYLGKETVQNVLAFRLANGIFEPVWNRKHIDHVQITVTETDGVGRRGGHYDQVGANGVRTSHFNPAGTWGPAWAHAFIERDGRHWRKYETASDAAVLLDSNAEQTSILRSAV